MSRWADWVAGIKGERRLAWLVSGGLALLTVLALWGYLQPAFAEPPTFAQDAAVPNPSIAQFDSFARLRGYEMNTDRVQPGDVLEIDLYWEVTGRPPGNYLLFLHLIDADGIMVAQRDTHPGLGNFPSSQWQSGDRFVDTVRLHMPETMYAPDEATLSLGLYVPDAYRLGITAENGAPVGDALPLDTITLVPAAGDVPNPLRQNFNDLLRLVGYEFNKRVLQPGEELAVTLYWEPLQSLSEDYEVEVELCQEPCADWMKPKASAIQLLKPPTSSWAPGQTITDTVILTIPPDLAADSYFIHVALIDPMTKEPQNILADDGHILEDHLLLARVRVEP